MYDLFTIESFNYLWHGVITGATPGMAAQDALDAQPTAFEDTVFEYGFHHILAASRRVAAGRRCKRRDEHAVEIDRYQKQLTQHYFPLIFFRLLHTAFSINA